MEAKHAAAGAVLLLTGATALMVVGLRLGAVEIARLDAVEVDLEAPRHPNVWLRGHTTEIGAVGFSGDGRRLASTSREAVIVWDAESAEIVGEYHGHPGTSRRVVLDHEGVRGMALGGEGISLWTVGEGGRITTDTIVPPQDRYQAIAFQADGRAIGAGGLPSQRDSLMVWDLRTDEVLSSWRLPRLVMRVSFDGSGTVLAAVDREGVVYLVRTGSDSITTLGGENRSGYVPVGLGAAATSVVWAADNSTALVRDLGGSRPDRLVSLDAQLRSFDLGADGTLILRQGDGIHLDIAGENAERVRIPMADFGRGVGEVALAPDGSRFATGMRDGSVLLWETAQTISRLRSGSYIPRVRRAPIEARNECLGVTAVQFGATPPMRGGNEFLAPPEFHLAEVLEYEKFRTYCYSVRNPEASAGGATSITLDISADREPSPPPLVSTGPTSDFARSRGFELTVPLVEYGSISPIGWDAFVASGEIIWDFEGNVGFFGTDSIPPGGTVHGIGLRSSYLPGLRSVSAEPTAYACCSEPLGDEEEFLPWASSFKVTSWAVGPEYRPEDMSVEILADQTIAVCSDPLWIRDSAACDALAAALAVSEENEHAAALVRFRRLLQDLRSRPDTVHDDAFWLLSINAAHLAGRY